MLKIIKIDELSKQTRKRKSRFEETKHWATLKEKLDTTRLKPGQAVAISLRQKDIKAAGLTHERSVSRVILKYIEQNGWDYEHSAIHTGDGVINFSVERPLADKPAKAAKK